MKPIHALGFFFGILGIYSCSSSPKTLSPVGDQEGSQTGIFSENDNIAKDASTSSVSSEIHTVEILETLETQKYSYLKVKEAGSSFWIATLKGDFRAGDRYHFTGGLLKKNFKSVEHNRTFDQLYLVSNIVPLNHGVDNPNMPVGSTTEKKDTVSRIAKNVEVSGSLRISDIIDKASNLSGQTVQVSGRVVKINPNIMDRSWIHLQDGSRDDFDLVVTTDESVELGSIVTFKAVVQTHKDFGAGYSYELILENGEVLN